MLELCENGCPNNEQVRWSHKQFLTVCNKTKDLFCDQQWPPKQIFFHAASNVPIFTLTVWMHAPVWPVVPMAVQMIVTIQTVFAVFRNKTKTTWTRDYLTFVQRFLIVFFYPVRKCTTWFTNIGMFTEASSHFVFRIENNNPWFQYYPSYSMSRSLWGPISRLCW